MLSLTRRDLLGTLLAAPALAQAQQKWIPLFDGRTLNGWKGGPNADSFRVVDGTIAVDGPRSHLYYDGPVRNADFRNFIVKAEVMTRPGCNSGFYFHTRFQEKGFPDNGFEVQVNNTAQGEGSYRERKKTASLYGVRDVYKQFVRDGEWFPLQIAVRGKRVQIHLKDMLVVDYAEPDPPFREGVPTGRILDHGTFALQCHDEGSKAFFRNILVSPLPDDLPDEKLERPVVDENYRDILRLQAHNYPVVDYHVNLHGLPLDSALRESRRLGIAYGIAVPCGRAAKVSNDSQAERFLKTLENQPVFIGMRAEGRDWNQRFSKSTLAKFDYILTDAPAAHGKTGDPQRFMDAYVERMVQVLSTEPIDIYANTTVLPPALAADYDRLWTPERMDQVIDAAKRNSIALEINERHRAPNAAFIRRAKAAGVKFAFGTDNTGRDPGRLEYGIAMVKECKLAWSDFFVPKQKLTAL